MKYPIEAGNPMKQSKLTRVVNLVDAWVETTIHDESIGYEEAFERVMAKIQAKTSETKRQQLVIVNDKFQVTTTYINTKSEAAGSISGQPHIFSCTPLAQRLVQPAASVRWQK